MRHLVRLAIVSFLALMFGGCAMYGNDGDLSKEGTSGVSYGRVKCAQCGFEFEPSVSEPAKDLTEEGVSGVSYGRVKCAKCGFEFKTPAKESGVDLAKEGVSGISYGRVKCPTCGFEFDVKDSEKDGH